MCEILDHAEHNRADKRECEIRGNDAQSADESHGKPPLVRVIARINAKPSKSFPPEKSALLLYLHDAPRRITANVVKKV
jgi:hypothetical protein